MQPDLTDLARAIEALVQEHLELTEKPAIALCLTLPPTYERVHWITNVSRSDGIKLFEGAATNMRAQIG